VDYLLLVEAPAYRVSETEFALESAFAEHLRRLRDALSDRSDRLVLMAPRMTEEWYAAARSNLVTLDAIRDDVHFVPLHPVGVGAVSFWSRHALSTFLTIWQGVARANVVHAGVSHDLFRPMLFFAMLAAVARRRVSVFVVDIDNRGSASMSFRSGLWSRRSYLVCKYLYDPLRAAQIHFAAQFCSVVLLKGRELVRDFGRGRPNVHHFYDTVHTASEVLSDERVSAKLVRLRDERNPLRAVYFGRFAPYKGIDRAIEAIHSAARREGRALELHLIGGGEQAEELRRIAREERNGATIRFHDAVPYGKLLFDKLAECDLAIATPLSEDTPRAAFDAMAMGLPIVAFDTSYYRDLASSGAVVVSEWPDVDALSTCIADLDRHREKLVQMALAAVRFARANTQDEWLARRVRWTFAALGEAPPSDRGVEIGGMPPGEAAPASRR
jgi:glycosyltransferase involved in cell wall biosynthesis